MNAERPAPGRVTAAHYTERTLLRRTLNPMLGNLMEAES